MSVKLRASPFGFRRANGPKTDTAATALAGHEAHVLRRIRADVHRPLILARPGDELRRQHLDLGELEGHRPEGDDVEVGAGARPRRLLRTDCFTEASDRLRITFDGATWTHAVEALPD
jgi:hypothetical protein